MSSHNDPVEPIPFDVAQPAPTLNPPDARSTDADSQGERPAWVLPALGCLVLLAVLVVVWLPTSLEPTQIEPTRPTPESAGSATAGQTNTAAPKVAPGNPDAAPWSDAQAAHLRKTAQEVAAELLEIQLALQERGIEQWAPTQFAEVVTLANTGDTLYRNRLYEEATTQYRQGLASLQALQEAIPQELKRLLVQAQQAIEQGDATTAQTALTTAAILTPDDSDIAALQQRANVLPQLMSLLEQAATAEAAGDLSQAQGLLQEAATLDPQHQRAQSELQRVAAAARQQGFNKAMSEGYAALDEGRYDNARASFRAAAKPQPGSTEADGALQEVAAAESARGLVTLDKQGRSYEQQEQWQKAVESYERAQKLDSSVLFAREGLKRSRTRAQLDQQLRKVIEEPGRLSDEAVATGAAQLLEQARQIAQSGPLLAQQIKQLDRLLIQADSPVAVMLRSDQETEVIVYKVARLGRFSEQQLSLRPGTYTAVGTRDGYRDVRRSFTLAHDTAAPPVTIICTEPIEMTNPAGSNPDVIAPSSFTPLEQAPAKPPSPRRPGRTILYVSLALVALVLAFLLTARSVQIVVKAEAPAELSVSGLALGLGQRYLLRPGDYGVSVTAEGYHPLVTTISVDERDNQSVELLLQALPGRLSIDSSPQGATVSVDGEAVGKTPLLDLPLEEGEHQLQLQEARHLPLQQTLQIVGRDVQQQLHLELEPGWAQVSVNSLPEGATILVDGETVGQTPQALEVLRGEHQLMLQLPSFADWQQTLQITPGEDQELGQINLQPASGALELSSVPAGANVTLDGEFQGQTPLTLEFSPDEEHRLAVFKPGYKRYQGTVQLSAAGSDKRVVTLQAQLGEVRFRISPANAMVRINGKPAGKGNQTLSLPAVAHSVEISLDGYASVRRRVTPRPGLAQLVEVTLQTQQEANMARIKSEVTTPLGQTLLLFTPADSPLADFTMGASRREPGRRANEVLHPVALRRMFYLQTTEVTNAQFRKFQPGHNSGQVEGNSLNQEHQPAVKVSWQQAAAFCNWLSAKEGLPAFYQEKNGIVTGYNSASTGYRLPSETEWAWAARANGSTLLLFPWGDTFPPTQKVENYADNTSAYVTGRILNDYQDGHVVSAPVASFKPNQHRLYDMGGNVSEWVHDVYTIPRANGATQTDPLGGKTGDNYVIRGASWTQSKLSELRLSYRDYGQAGRDDVGFRIARYAE